MDVDASIKSRFNPPARDAEARKDSHRLIAPRMMYPLPNQSARIATLGRFTISRCPLLGLLRFHGTCHVELGKVAKLVKASN